MNLRKYRSKTIWALLILLVINSTSIMYALPVATANTLNNIGILTTVAGTGTAPSGTDLGDGGSATLAGLKNPKDVAVDSSGNIYVSDQTLHRVRKIDTNGIITTVAGTGTAGYNGDNITATTADLNSPTGIAVDNSGNLYIADYSNHRIRKVDSEGIITTVAGNGFSRFFGEGIAATASSLSFPSDVAVDQNGNLFIADFNNNRVRKVDSEGVITTVAGNGIMGDSGEGGLAVQAQLKSPYGVAVDNSGNVFFVALNSHRLQEIDNQGYIHSLAGTGTSGTALVSDQGQPAATTQLSYPRGVAVDPDGNPYVSQSGSIFKVDLGSGMISRVAGKGFTSISPDGGLAVNSYLNSQEGITIDSSNNLYIAEYYNYKVRKVALPSTQATTATISGNAGVSGATVRYNDGTEKNVITDSQGNYSITVPLNWSGSVTPSKENTTFTPASKTYTTIAADQTSQDYTAEEDSVPQLPIPTITSAVGGDKYVTLKWNNISDAMNYKVFVSTTSGSYDEEVPYIENDMYGTENTEFTYTKDNLENGTTYYFRVRAVFEDGTLSERSNEVSATPQAAAPNVPSWKSATSSDGKVTLEWNGVEGASGYKIYQSTESNSYGVELANVTNSVSSYESTGLVNGTTYYYVIKSVSENGDSAPSLEVNAMPKAVPGAPTAVTAIAGNRSATVSFVAPEHDGGRPITKYVVTSNLAGVAAVGTGGPITVTGLTNGISYTFTVHAVNEVGNGAESGASNAVTPAEQSNGGSGSDNSNPGSSGSGSSDSSSSANLGTGTVPAKPADDGVEILVNGKVERAATASTIKVADKSVTKVTIDEAKLDQKLKQEGNHALVTVPVKTTADSTVAQLNGQMLKKMENQWAVLKIKTPLASYTIPAEQFQMDAVSAQLGSPTSLENLDVKVEISNGTAETVATMQNSAAKDGLALVAPVVEYKVTLSHNNKTLEVNRFNAYVERMIAIPDGVDPSKITTGVVLNADGTLTHVPTEIVIEDGKYYAKINSLTNSAYSVVWHPKEFADMAAHWAKQDVNDMASRTVIEGVSDTRFEPGRAITRAEFAAILVRGLGLVQTATGKTGQFLDVTPDNWSASAVEVAANYGLIQGYEDQTFRPKSLITREEAMAMMARAMKLTGLNTGSALWNETSSKFSDSGTVGKWATGSIASCIETGLVQGYQAQLKPKDNIVRAEAAAVIRRLLQKSELINN